MNASAVTSLIDPAAEWGYRRVLCREAYGRGWRDGWEAGRRALLEELAADQVWMCGPANAVLASPDHVVLEARRWGPGGRGRFGDPHPGDFGGAAAGKRRAS